MFKNALQGSILNMVTTGPNSDASNSAGIGLIWKPYKCFKLLLVSSLLIIMPCAESHHWIPRKHQMGHNVRMGNPNVFKRQSFSQKLRFEVVYDESINELSDEQNALVRNKLIPEAVEYFHNTLRVRPSKLPIKLQRTCENNAYFLKDSKGKKAGDVQHCKLDCIVTECGPVVVPRKHLDQCRVCDRKGQLCGEKPGSEWSSGSGVKNKDFILYVSSNQTQHCRIANAVAYASYCQQEHVLDRPVAGFANLCPDRLDTDPRHYSNLISTLKHEVYHALGFSAGLYAFYRDKHGTPLTTRDKHGLPLYNENYNLYQWSEKVVKRVTRKWDVRRGHVNHTVYMIVTPRVKRVVRNHFNCPTLEGAEIENQGGTGTELTHWEKRLFENEAMTGTYTQNPVFSRLTLAMMEDTGWYKANYSMADTLDWGRNLGCSFAKKSCKTWMETQMRRNHSSEPFCYTIKQAPLHMRCTHSKLSIALCNLRKYAQPLPQEYQYFRHLPEVHGDHRKSRTIIGETSSYGGAVALADYCPFYQKFTLTGMNGAKRETTCTIRENAPSKRDNYALEAYGRHSRCVEQGRHWQAKRGLLTRTMLDWGSGCYKYRCKGGVQIEIQNRTYPCRRAGQHIEIRGKLRDWNVSGSLVCPSCAHFCGDTAGCPVEFEDSSDLDLTLREKQDKNGASSFKELSGSKRLADIITRTFISVALLVYFSSVDWIL